MPSGARSNLVELDIEKPGEDDLALLRNVFELHALALEDVAHFNQRPKDRRLRRFRRVLDLGQPIRHPVAGGITAATDDVQDAFRCAA
jgi:hypothetical protein